MRKTSGHTNIISENAWIQSKYHLHFALIRPPLNVIPTHQPLHLPGLFPVAKETVEGADTHCGHVFVPEAAALSRTDWNQLFSAPGAIQAPASPNIPLLLLRCTLGSPHPCHTWATDTIYQSGTEGGHQILGVHSPLSSAPVDVPHLSPLHSPGTENPPSSWNPKLQEAGAAHSDSPHHPHLETGWVLSDNAFCFNA